MKEPFRKHSGKVTANLEEALTQLRNRFPDMNVTVESEQKALVTLSANTGNVIEIELVQVKHENSDPIIGIMGEGVYAIAKRNDKKSQEKAYNGYLLWQPKKTYGLPDELVDPIDNVDMVSQVMQNHLKAGRLPEPKIRR